MTAYLIVYGADPSDRFACYAYPDRAAARAASLTSIVPHHPPEARAGGCAYVIDKPEDVTFGGQLLVDVYNAVSGSSVTRFESRSTGITRLMAVLETIQPPTQEHTMPETETSTRGRKALYSGDQVIKLLVTENPKKEGKGNHARFAALMGLPDPVTVAAANAAGVPNRDLKYDEEHGFLKVE